MNLAKFSFTELFFKDFFSDWMFVGMSDNKFNPIYEHEPFYETLILHSVIGLIKEISKNGN